MTSQNPYEAPVAGLEPPPDSPIPKAVLVKIQIYWVTACLSGVIYVALAVSAYYGDPPSILWLLFTILASITLSLAYGVYKKSKKAAILLLVIEAVTKVGFACVTPFVWVMTLMHAPILFALSGPAVALVFIPLCIIGAKGIFQYHSIVGDRGNYFGPDKLNHPPDSGSLR